MAIFYLDFELGSDAADGTSWANAWKTLTLGATAARIAPGDTIRIAKTPDAATLGQNLTWVQNKKKVIMGKKVGLMTSAWTFSANVSGAVQAYGGFDDGVDNGYSPYIGPSAAFTTGLMAYHDLATHVDLTGYTQFSIWIKTSVALTAGDFSIVLDDTHGCTSPLETLVSSYASADTGDYYEYTWSLANPAALGDIASIGIVMNQDRGGLTFYVSAAYAWNRIANTLPVCVPEETESARWTAAANVTKSLVTPAALCDRAMRIAPAAAFTTGVACYKDYASGQDWSGYTHVSALIRVYGSAVQAGVMQLCIDDTVGCASPLESISTVRMDAYAYIWHKFKISNPAALTAVRSIGFSFASDPGTPSVDICAMFLSNGFTGNCLVSDAINATDWYTIAGHRGSFYMNLGTPDDIAGVEYNAPMSKTAEGFYRQTLVYGSYDACPHIVKESGTAGNLITFSGGWNRTNSAQDGETWFDNGGYTSSDGMIKLDAARDYIKFEKLALIRGSVQFNGTYYLHNYCEFNFPMLAWGRDSGFGTHSHHQTIVVGTLARGNMECGKTDSYRNSYTITRAIENSSTSATFILYGVDQDLVIGSAAGHRSYPLLTIGSMFSRITCGDIHGGSMGHTALNLSSGQSNQIKFTGDITGRTSGSTGVNGFYISQSGNNTITFTKSGAVLSHFSPGIYVQGSYGVGGNIISGVELKDNGSADITVYGYGGECIFQWVKLSSATKFYFGAGTYGTTMRFHHYGQVLNDHRTFFAGMDVTTSPPSFVRDTVNADADDCIDVTLTAGLTGGGVAFIPIGWVTLTGGVSQVVSIKMKKDVNFNGRVPMIGLQGEGTLVDMTRSGTALTTSYQTYSLAAVTPARSQYARVFIMVDGTAGHLYIDSLSVA